MLKEKFWPRLQHQDIMFQRDGAPAHYGIGGENGQMISWAKSGLAVAASSNGHPNLLILVDATSSSGVF